MAEVKAAEGSARSSKARRVGANVGATVGAGNPGVPAGSGDTGPGTGVASPADATVRPPDRALSYRVGAAPLEAPDAANQVLPTVGYPQSSTDPVVGNHAALSQNYTGDYTVALVNEATNTVIADPATIFEVADPTKTYRVVAINVKRRHLYKGMKANGVPVESRYLRKGQHVSLDEALGIAQAVTAAAALLAAETALQTAQR